MSEVSALTLDELRARMTAVDLPIAVERLEMIRKLLADALTPVRRMDARSGANKCILQAGVAEHGALA